MAAQYVSSIIPADVVVRYWSGSRVNSPSSSDAERAEMEIEAVLSSERRIGVIVHPGCMLLSPLSKIVARVRKMSSRKKLMYVWETHEAISPFDSTWTFVLAREGGGGKGPGPLVGCRAPEMFVVDTSDVAESRLRQIKDLALQTVRAAYSRTAIPDDTRSCHPRDCLRMVLRREALVVGKRALIVDRKNCIRASLLIAPHSRVALCVHAGDFSRERISEWDGVCENSPTNNPRLLAQIERSKIPEIFEKVSKRQKHLPDSLNRLFRQYSIMQAAALRRVIPLVILGVIVAYAMLLERESISDDDELFTSSSTTTCYPTSFGNGRRASRGIPAHRLHTKSGRW